MTFSKFDHGMSAQVWLLGIITVASQTTLPGCEGRPNPEEAINHGTRIQGIESMNSPDLARTVLDQSPPYFIVREPFVFKNNRIECGSSMLTDCIGKSFDGYSDKIKVTLKVVGISTIRTGIGYTATLWNSSTLKESDLCEGSPNVAVARAGSWTSDGRWTPATDRITFFCQHSASDECTEYLDYGLRDYFVTCVRMRRADYCGDGKANTVTAGGHLDVIDSAAISPGYDHGKDPLWLLEAGWGTTGAVCIQASNFKRGLPSCVTKTSCDKDLFGPNELMKNLAFPVTCPTPLPLTPRCR